MKHHLTVVEDEPTDGHCGVFEVLNAEPSFHCVRVSWLDFQRAGPALATELLVAVATSSSQPSTEALQWLACRKESVPALAVLPSEADASLLALATNVVDDFVLMPVRPLELQHRVGRFLSGGHGGRDELRERLLEEMTVARLVGRDPAFLDAVEQVPRFARSDVPVLVTGETGTGKELCARALHQLSRRRDAPFVAVDCGSIPEQLFENELFGHARGAFTGADREHKGLAATAQGGTLFLDEIDALSLASQAKLLRFLQEHTYRPLGSDRAVHADLRIVAATNRDLERAVCDKLFRSDLYFRLNVLSVHLPPLRVRSGDVEILAESVLNQVNQVLEGPRRSFSRAALRALCAHSWPGNIRELGNVVQRAAVTCEGERILPCHIRLVAARATFGSPSATAGEFRSARAAAVATFERHYVEGLLRKHRGKVTQAAREACQDRRAFGRFIKKYQIDRSTL